MFSRSFLRPLARRTLVLSLSLLVLVLTFAGRAPSEPASAVVEMSNTLRFEPAEVRISAGEVVEWRNTSDLVHTVTADPAQATMEDSVELPDGVEPFHSGNLRPGQTYRHTFSEPGTYRYFSIPHEGAGMRGTVVVE